MSWMAWRFAQYVKEQTRNAKISERELASRFRQFREKIELLFTLGNPDFPQIAGQTRRNFLDEKGKRFPLEFSAFGSYKVSWLDAAVYGPSLNAESGLGFLERAPGNSYRPTAVGEELALALDDSLQRADHYRTLCDVDNNGGSRELVEDLADRWAVRKSNAKERACFRKVFFPEEVGEEGSTLVANRVAMIRLVLEAVKAQGHGATIDQVRQSIARGITRRGKRVTVPEATRTQAMWSVLQIRQLQRLAHEALLRWVELVLLDRPEGYVGSTPAALSALAIRHASQYLDVKPSSSLEVIWDRVDKGNASDFYFAGLRNSDVDPFDVMERLLDMRNLTTDTPKVPGVALHALTLCAKQAEAMAEDEDKARWLTTGGRSRLALRTLIDAFQTYRDQSFGTFVQFLIESCVIGQHFAVTAAKLEANKNKYRFISTEDGLRLLIRPDQLTRLAVTGDRLANAMELMSDCGILQWTEDGFAV